MNNYTLYQADIFYGAMSEEGISNAGKWCIVESSRNKLDDRLAKLVPMLESFSGAKITFCMAIIYEYDVKAYVNGKPYLKPIDNIDLV